LHLIETLLHTSYLFSSLVLEVFDDAQLVLLQHVVVKIELLVLLLQDFVLVLCFLLKTFTQVSLLDHLVDLESVLLLYQL